MDKLDSQLTLLNINKQNLTRENILFSSSLEDFALFSYLYNSYDFVDLDFRVALYLELLAYDISAAFKIAATDLIAKDINIEEVILDCPDIIYRICQTSENFTVFLHLLKKGIRLDVNLFLYYGCLTSNTEYLGYITSNYDIADKALEDLLIQVVCGSFYDDETGQDYLAEYLVDQLGVEINLKSGHMHTWLYQECLDSSPHLSSLFINNKLNVDTLYDAVFWQKTAQEFFSYDDNEVEAYFLDILSTVKQLPKIDIGKMTAIFEGIDIDAVRKAFS